MTPRKLGIYKVAAAAGLIKRAAGMQDIGGGEGGGGGVTEYDMEPMDIKGEVKKSPAPKAVTEYDMEPMDIKGEVKKSPAPKAVAKAAPKAAPKEEAKGPAPKVAPKAAPKSEFAQQAQSSIDDLGARLGLDTSNFAAAATPGNPLEYDMEPMNIRGQAPAGGGRTNPFANLSYLDPFSEEAAYADVGGMPARPASPKKDRIDQMLASLNFR